MKENLLHFIWKLKLFSVNNLCSTLGEKIQIISVGTENFNSGPDFLNSKIEINGQLWAGNVEIHLNSSDWYVHQHEIDENYDSVILHVVWNHDIDVFRKNNNPISTLELKEFVSVELLDNYKQLFNKKKHWINCENSIETVGSFTIKNWIERLYFERLEQKANYFQEVLNTTNNNWEATLFVLLAKNFGLKINADAFLNTALSFDFSILRKVAHNQYQLEALLFGQAGLLGENIENEYFKQLQSDYNYLKVKFKLVSISKNEIQFFRLRPNNFPTIRLSQLASLYYKFQNLFSKIIEIEHLVDFYAIFNVSTSQFWETHYTFNKESKKSTKKLTKSFIDLLLINTIIPLKFMYLKALGATDYTSVISLIEQLKPEKNTIISKFNELIIKSNNAFETQALLQLKNEYCSKQLCLQCAIGKELLKP
ncbi:DUF2851 family protein [Lutibacter maritimus]|uniref:DUF2851 domain-containing protein n=1 Tax=Lutibacter maritimus TaxID=593133 RepID=A0A1I6RZS7_9FLAO|nr:DUF2851 family protein [Lutibacter maritimus]SFS70209.1 Protein of unknown function [Lutibacter maritimus]